MQTCGSALLTVLESSQRDLPDVDLFEFYPPTQTVLFPENAVKRFAASEIVWFGWKYQRQAISRGDISRFIDGRFSNVSLTLSNVDRAVSTWLSGTAIEGYRVVIRMVSRSVSNDSVVLFVGRCEKPFDVDNTTVQIAAKQDLGSIENDLPWNQFQAKCPLKFKGVECLAGEALGSKSAAYQAAAVCNKSYRQCQEYENTEAFQGVRFNAITGNFKVSQRRGGAGGAILGLIGLGNKKVTKQYSSQDATPYGQSVPLGLGRTQIETVAVKYADTGQYLAGQWIIGEGEITKILDPRNVSAGWATTFQAYSEHLGKFGTQAGQAPAGFFASDGDRHSHRAYIEATIKGDNPDSGDPAPTLVGTILWQKIPVFLESCFLGLDWSDNPVEQLRYLLTEPRSLNYNAAWINNEIAAMTAAHCNEPLVDQSGGEDVYVSTANGTPGIAYKRYRSTGLLDTHHFRKVLGLTATYPAEREVAYNTFNPASPPATITPGTYYRRRYTSSFHIIERIKAVDFIFKSLLPCFRGYLITGSDGRLQIKAEQPTVTSLLRSTASAGATSLAIEDALAWKSLNIPVFYVLVGVGEAHSETRRVTAINFSTAGNSITLAASSTGGVTATRSSSTFFGGTTEIQAEATVTIGGSPANGNTVTITIDGVGVSYTLNANDTTGTVAGIMAARINANTTLNRYVQALWTPDLPNVITLRSKLGTLTVAALTSTHTTAETVIHVHLPFSDVAFGALTRGNILRDSFKWPLGSKQTSFNQFVLTFNDAVQDFQPTELRENVYEHQEAVNKVDKLEISGACVDNYHQADRLLQAARYKYRGGDFFCSISTAAGLALLLEEGDVICANHANLPNQRNLPFRIEELKITQDHRVNLIARLYADDQFPLAATERTVSLTSGIGWVGSPPPAVFNVDVSSPSAGALDVMFNFGDYIGEQEARIEVKRQGETDFSGTGLRITPDANNQGFFQLTSVPAGVTEIRITPSSSAGDGLATVASFDSNEPEVDVLEFQVFDLPDENLEVEVMS